MIDRILVERPKTSRKTKKLFVELTFSFVIILWMGCLTIAVVHMDDNFKRRIKHLESEVADMKASQKMLLEQKSE